MTDIKQQKALSDMNTQVEQTGAGDGVAEMLDLMPLQAGVPSGPAVLGNNVGLFGGVKVTLSVTVGQIHSTVGELMALKELSLLKIDRALDAPVDVIVDGNVVARGQLVAIDDNFGVRITEVAQAVAA